MLAVLIFLPDYFDDNSTQRGIFQRLANFIRAVGRMVADVTEATAECNYHK